jgi:hypothetical protein
MVHIAVVVAVLLINDLLSLIPPLGLDFPVTDGAIDGCLNALKFFFSF